MKGEQKRTESVERRTVDRGLWTWGQFLKERKSILQKKWYRSGEAGRDIGIEGAVRDWLDNHAHKLNTPSA